MTLGDFFTLTETKDGLTSSDRVNELVNIMIREKDHAIKNWSTVASTIAATKDKDCLNLFVKLDGISFINKWLEDAQNLDNEESTVSLLNAIEKLSISYEQSVAYGTREIVEKLFGHSSVVVQEKAKLVFGSWKEMDDGEAIKGLGSESGQTVSCEGDIDSSVGIIHEEKHVKIDGDKVDYIETRMDNEEKDLGDENMKDEILLKKPFEESLHSEAEDTLCQIEGKPSDSTSTGAVPKEDRIVSNQFSGKEEQMQVVASPIEKLRATEVSPSPMENDSEPVIGSDLETDSVRKIDNNSKESASYDMIGDMPLSSKDDNNAMNVDATPPNHSEPMDEVSQKLSGDYATNVLDSSGNQDRSPKIESPDTSSLRGDSDSINSEHSTSESEVVANDTDFLKNKTKDNIVANKNMSDFDLSYGMVDALEVARQVAIEVEREVEGRRETSYSSSSQKDQNDQSSPVNETQTRENDPKVNSSQLPNDVQMAESKPEKGIIHFDLNDEICCSDDTDQPLDTTSTHVSIVSASRAAAAPGFPVTPLQFDGAHGWKGSAATSAFRPASPRKNDTFDNDTKRNQNFLDFDLNMCENGDEKAADFDLNRVSDERDERDEGDAPLSRFRERILLRNSHHNASPSLSSSSMRNFDLNNQPSFLNDSSELNFFANSSSSQNVGSRSNRNVISIMGTKVEVDRKNTFSQQPFLPNGSVFDPALDVNLTRNGGIMGIPYQVQVPGMFTYNGLTNGPSGPIMYGPGGPIPYMVPQLMGSVSASPAPFTGIYGMHPPGFNGPGPSTGFNGPGPSTGFNGPGPSRPNFDLNLGLNRESGVLRQFLGPGQNFQPSTSAGIGKRKEPDGGWEGYPFEYKHHQWK